MDDLLFKVTNELLFHKEDVLQDISRHSYFFL